MKESGLGGDVAIVGAGLIGLAIAFELAARGAIVRVFDRGEPGHGASWAGAGMLAPYTERIEDDELLASCVASLAMYPSFVRRVRDAGGVDAQLHLHGIADAAFDDAYLEKLQAHATDLRTRGIACEMLDRRDTIAREPSLGKHVTGSLVVKGEGCVDNRRLGRALVAACEARGVSIVRNVEHLAIECDVRRVLGVRAQRGFTPASYVVNAAGAWSAMVPGIPDVCMPPVEPVKGQMLALAIPQGFVRHTTWVPGAYLVPREDGRLLIGATVEHAGFDERVTAGGVSHLLGAALAAAPSLSGFSVTETWAGLRPGTPDGRPCVGATPLEGLFNATGHYRNGILLAPVTAHAIAGLIEGAAALAPRMTNA
jgi:glycine oxidase